MCAFNFASRTFAYRRLAQGLSRSLSAFPSFTREYLDTLIKADPCAHHVDDIGIAANTVTQLCINIRAAFECIRNAGLKLSMSKCHFGGKQVDFLGRTTTPEGVFPQVDKVKDFLAKPKFRRSKKGFQRYIGFLHFYRNYIPRLSERLTPFFKLLKETNKFYISTEFTSNWQKDDNIIVAHDDLYAHTWHTNFGTDPFDTELPDNEQVDILEHVPINRPPSLEISKNSGRAPVELTTVPNVETPIENAGIEIDEIHNQQDLQPNPTIDAGKSPGKTDENQENDEVQKEKTPTNTRGEKYNLRPNPNPNFSDSYRY